MRNPYERILSECSCEWGCHFAEKNKFKKVNNKIRFKNNDCLNEYIKQRVNDATNTTNFHHFTPQHMYTHKNGNQIVHHVIKYENINEFNELMKQYSTGIVYEKKNHGHLQNVNDISKENIRLINDMYDLDFKLFGYEKIIV